MIKIFNNRFYLIALSVITLISCKTMQTKNSIVGKEFTTESGLRYVITHEGTGERAKVGDKVVVHYTGKLTNDSVFDSSVNRGQPFSFKLGVGQVIKGWDEGVALLNVGDKATFTIPSDLAYGERGAGGVIGPNETLIFDVELLEIKEGPKPFDVSGKDTLTTESGLKYIKLNSTDGTQAEANKIVKVHYSGYLEDGSMFDSSIERGQPLDFPLGQGRVIKGWDEGIALLKVGEKARLIIPHNLGYGEKGHPPVIPAKATLIFDVELMDVK
ncbi:MAG: FKBP-type peptidyl-prolyl cis-trans isomerase [Flavobacteriales bacterium]|nr:FKBP-type peptidyl-prolyl cis-trans isomerase [Flavobacteriales bacterium]MCB9365003.1 FKBP-type peptidyl-prolyl cis-trans isomerase [Flavobacteriales bacterium]